jgi:translocation and assembly module TamA
VTLTGVENPLRGRLIAALPDRAAPQTAFEAERLSEEAASLLMEALREEGHYAARVTPQPMADPPRANVAIDPGPVFRIAAVTHRLERPIDPPAQAAFDQSLAALATGAPARAADVLAIEAAGRNTLRLAGYPDAAALARDVVVDHADQTMRVALAFDPGAAAKFGAVRVAPEGIVRQDLIETVSQITPGQSFSPAPVQQLRSDLLATGVFSSVAVDLAEQPDAQGLRDVIVTLEPAKRRVVELGAGWSTSEGPGVEATFTTRNSTGRADTLALSAGLSEQQQRLSADLDLPHGGGRGRAWRLGVAAERDISGPFERIGAKLSAAQDSDPRRELAVIYGATISADSFTRSEGVEQAFVVSGHIDLRRDDTDDPLDAREGAILEARLEPSISAGDAGAGFVRATAQARGYVSFGEDRAMTLAARAKIGFVDALIGDDDDIPPDRRFYAGGGGSVRGYAFNSLFPDREADQVPGGAGLVESSIELRGRFDDRLGAVAFLDAGAAFNTADELEKIRWGAGIGLRYDLGFGPLRIDLATPLDRRGGDAPVSVYISIGQAF